MLHTPFYDPEKTYKENFEQGPFGAFAQGSGDPKGVSNENSGEPQYDFLGVKVFSPFGIPSGPLINGKFVKAALDKGFDLVEYKNTRTRARACNPMPNIIPLEIEGKLTLEKAAQGLKPAQEYKEPIAITNSFGIPSMDPSFWQEDLRDAVLYAKKGQVVIGGLQGTLPESGGFEAYLEDFRLIARLMRETGVKVIELNLSCPNEGVNNLLCFDTERSAKVIETVKREIGDIPLIIKISYFPDEAHVEELIKAVAGNVQAVAAINTIVSKIVDEEGRPALTGGRLVSGTCGAPIKWAGLDMTRKLKRIREKLGLDYVIIGVGGIIAPDDFFEYREAGADAVMSATGAMWNPYLAREIKARLFAEDPRLRSGEKLR